MPRPSFIVLCVSLFSLLWYLQSKRGNLKKYFVYVSEYWMWDTRKRTTIGLDKYSLNLLAVVSKLSFNFNIKFVLGCD